MKRYLLALALLLVGGAGLNAQTVTVTGHMKSGNTSNVTSKAFMRFRLRNFSGNTPRVTSTGAIVQTQFDVTPDNTGTITTSLYGNDVISPVNTFWTVETWYNGVFQFSYNYGICASTQVTYCSTVGATFNLDSASPISFPTPPAPYLPLPGPTGPTGPQGPIGPQGPPGAGGSGPTLQTNNGTNSSQTLLNLLNGTNVSMTNSGGGVTVNAVPSTPVKCLQYDNAGAFAGASGICTPDGGTSLSIKGVEPWASITAWGTSASVISVGDGAVTVTCTNGSPSVSLASASNFVNGEGVTLQNCGPAWNGSGSACVAATGLTVTPSFAAGPVGSHLVVNSTTGSTTYYYRVVARDVYGGLCAPSASTEITNGLASLGLQTASVTAASRATSLLTLTVTAPVTTGTMVGMGQTTNMNMLQAGGWGQIASNSGTQVVIPTSRDVRAMPLSVYDQTSAGSGGDISWLQGNALTWTGHTGDAAYYVCESPDNSTWSLIGITKFSNADTGYTDTAYEDFGSAYTGAEHYPFYVTAAICNGGGQNDPLTTTISSGAGTTSLTLANSASNNNTVNNYIEHDAGPNLLAAANSVSFGGTAIGTVFIPPSAGTHCYPINSFTRLPKDVNIVQAGNICTQESIISSTAGNMNWSGAWGNNGGGQFATVGGAAISAQTNNPALILESASNVDHVSFGSNANGSTLVTLDNYNGSLTNDSFVTDGSASTDVSGIAITVRDTTQTIDNTYLRDSLIAGGPTQLGNSSWTPLFLATVPSSSNELYWIHMSRMQWSRRGMAIIGFGNCASLTMEDGSYRQGGIQPMLTDYNCAVNSYFSLKHEKQDTEGQPRIFNMQFKGSPGAGYSGTFYFEDIQGGSTPEPMLFTGVGPLTLTDIDDPQDFPPAIPNVRVNSAGFSNTVVASPYQTGSGTPAHEALNYLGMPTLVTGGFPIGAALPPPTAITSNAPTAGGSIPNGTYVWDVAAADIRGALSILNPNVSTSQVAGSGNNTEAISWTGSTGALSYNVYRAPTSTSCVSGGPAINCAFYQIATGVTGTSYSDTSASISGNAQPSATASIMNGIDNAGIWSDVFSAVEGSAPTGKTNVDMLYGDSTAHAFKECANNGSCYQLPGFTITPTNNDCVNWSGTAGLLGDASGKCGHYTITPTNGDCVTWSGTGGLLGDAGAACGTPGGGMDTNMDNMANPTLMNHSLVPASANTIAVGTQALPFTNAFLGTVANQAGSFDTSALTANHVIKFPNADSTAVQNCASVSHEWISQILQSTGACTQTQPTLADVSAGASPAGLFNFSGSTMEIPQGAGFTAASNSTLGIDTTAKALHSWINAADSFVASFASAPAGSKCAQTSGTIGQLTEAAAACGTTTPSSTETPTNKNFNAEGTGNALSEPVRAYFGAGGCNNSTASNGFDIGVTNAPTPQCAGTTVRKGVLQFARGNVAYLNFHASSDINLSASVDLEICFTTTDTTNGHVTSFGIQTGFNKTDGTVTDDPTLNATQALSVTTGASQTSGGELCGKLTGLTTTGAAADYNFEIAITRNNTGTDTNTDTAVAVKSAEVIYGVTKNAANR